MRCRHRGFSLLEMIAVLAITSILAGALVPSLVRSIQDSFASAEETSLNTLASLFELYVLEQKRIPSPTPADWASALAGVASEPQANIERNQRGHTRAIFFDPLFFTTTATNFTGFSQDLGLTARPNSPRLMFVSDLTTSITTQNLSPSQFDAIWNQSATALHTESEDVKIVRLNLAPLFKRVHLTNQTAQDATFSFENASKGAVGAKIGTTDGQVERYVIRGSLMQLFGSPYPSIDLHTSTLIVAGVGYRYVDNSGTGEWVSP